MDYIVGQNNGSVNLITLENKLYFYSCWSFRQVVAILN